MTITFVSSNEEKFYEIRATLAGTGRDVRRVSLDLPEIQALDPVEVAAHKARAAWAALGEGSVLVEDTGLGVDVWGGYPGALVKWVVAAVGEAGLCRQLDAWNDRRATATAALCLFDGATLRPFVGVAHGVITDAPRGTFGFGWDSIFQPDGYSITYGEMPREEKLRISMRSEALRQLREFLSRS